MIKKLILLIGIVLIVGCVQTRWSSMDNCLEEVERYCSNQFSNNNDYNECKFDKFYNDCSRGDCLRYHAYNVENPELLTKEMAEKLIDEGVIEESVINCFEKNESKQT